MCCTHMSTKPAQHILKHKQANHAKQDESYYTLQITHVRTMCLSLILGNHKPVNSPKKRLQTSRSRGRMLSLSSSLVRWIPNSSSTRGSEVSTSPTTYRQVWEIKTLNCCSNIQIKTSKTCTWVGLTCERILYSGSSTNSTKLRCELLLGAFLVNFLLIDRQHNQSH